MKKQKSNTYLILRSLGVIALTLGGLNIASHVINSIVKSDPEENKDDIEVTVISGEYNESAIRDYLANEERPSDVEITDKAGNALPETTQDSIWLANRLEMTEKYMLDENNGYDIVRKDTFVIQ